MQTPSQNPDEVTIHDMKSALDNPSLGIQVIDVREANEHAAARVSGTVLIPLSELPNRCCELDPKRPYYLHCKGGVRSLRAVAILKDKGINNVKSVAGGIQAWIADKYPCIAS
jgi:rhodanese-related sulfurtransferase